MSLDVKKIAVYFTVAFEIHIVHQGFTLCECTTNIYLFFIIFYGHAVFFFLIPIFLFEAGAPFTCML